MSDNNSAKQAARRVYKRVAYQDGPLSSYELTTLLTQTYEILKIPFKPTQNDIKFYEQVLDADRDGKVTLKDLQTRAVQYLCSNTLISSISGGNKLQTSYGKSDYQVGSQKSNDNTYSSYSEQKNSYGQGLSSYQPNNYAQSTQNKYSSYQSQQTGYNYNYKPSIPSKSESNPSSLNAFGLDTVYTHGDKSVYSQSGYSSNLGQTSERSFKNTNYGSDQYAGGNVNKSYGGLDSSNTNNYNYSTQSYGQNDTAYGYDQTQATQNYGQTQYANQQQNQQRPYSQTVKQYLKVVGQVFMTYADQNQFNVTEADVPSLLTDTYAVLGREGYNPSKQDVQTWMKLCDVNQDGKVEFQEYQYFVVKSLERSGLDLYED